MKRCTKCDLKRELHEFYKSKSTNDGYHNSCKECWKTRRKERYVENRDGVRKQCRRYYVENAEHLKSKSRLHKKTYDETKRWRKSHPEKYKAHYTVNNALKRGEIMKAKECRICGSQTKLHAHHADYSKPLDVLWVCIDCHSKIHIKEV